MTMRERINCGKLYTDLCEELPIERALCQDHLLAFNQSTAFEIEERLQAMDRIFGKRVAAWIDPPFYCSYGTNISIGSECCIGYNCNFIDSGKISIGNKVVIDPAVTITTVGRPLHPGMREYMYAAAVTIEDNCWIGAGTTIHPGVTIGKNSVVAAGSVVTEDIPANCIASGSPCRVIRFINEQDTQFYFNDRPILDEDIAEIRFLSDNS